MVRRAAVPKAARNIWQEAVRLVRREAARHMWQEAVWCMQIGSGAARAAESGAAYVAESCEAHADWKRRGREKTDRGMEYF